MKQNVFRALSVLFLLAGLLLMLEGGFHISTAKREALDQLVPKNLNVEHVNTNAGKKLDVAVSVYRDLEAEDSYYILEFSKNALFDRYALTELHHWDRPRETFQTVVSSSIHSYAYSVDIAEGSIRIYPPQRNASLGHHIVVLSMGVITCLCFFWKKSQKNMSF